MKKIKKKAKIKIKEAVSFANKNDMNFYFGFQKAYYKLDNIPTLEEYIKYNIYLINSDEYEIKNSEKNKYDIKIVESLEEYLKSTKLNFFNDRFDKKLMLLTDLQKAFNNLKG